MSDVCFPLSTGEGRIPLNREGGATGNQTLLSSRTKRKRNHARRQVTRSPDREPCPRTLRTSPPSCGGVAPGERLSFRPIAFASSETAEYRDAVGDRHRTPGVPSPRGLWLCGPAAPDPPPVTELHSVRVHDPRMPLPTDLPRPAAVVYASCLRAGPARDRVLDLALDSGMPLAKVTMLVELLREAALVVDTPPPCVDRRLLERVLEGLRRL